MAIVHFGSTRFDADLVLFDKDGTLIDFHALWSHKVVAGVEQLLAVAGDRPGLRGALFQTLGYDEVSGRFATQGPVVTASMQALYTVAATVLYQHGCPWLEADLTASREMAAAMANTFHPAMIRPLGEVRALLEALRAAGVHVGVITSDDEGPAWRTLEILGVAHTVQFLAGSDGGYAHKPAPDAVLAACARLGVTPARTVVVGDSTTDLLMGQRAGVGLCAGVTSGLMDATVLAPMAGVVLASIAEIHVDGAGSTVKAGNP